MAKASDAFTPEFRAKLADAVTKALASGRRVYPKKKRGACCPFGALVGRPLQPGPSDTSLRLNLSYRKVADFMNGFDGYSAHNPSPEFLLGKLYRARALVNNWGTRTEPGEGE